MLRNQFGPHAHIHNRDDCLCRCLPVFPHIATNILSIQNIMTIMKLYIYYIVHRHRESICSLIHRIAYFVYFIQFEWNHCNNCPFKRADIELWPQVYEYQRRYIRYWTKCRDDSGWFLYFFVVGKQPLLWSGYVGFTAGAKERKNWSNHIDM